ncbi:hypothetical protein [Catalinimonas niigatensis]|uniref:hypothetical protein n=1 Tax=Catalinimonas niigatensis TaxID=1397264 RepID=UPI0026663023|nr:hypothetical protein [Catalinimonas niigatensis]WPP48413.1 hypothetical protein PZB72_17210 [Catalinimonas niigatensis]
MKILFPLWPVLIISIMLGCSPQPEAVIKFCDSLDQNEQCQTDRDHFRLGERVYVSLESNSSFETKRINGNIYRLTEDMKIPLSNKYFDLEEGDTFISQSIPFHEFGQEAIGTFSIEFTDENDQVIAKRELIISRE